MKYTLRTRSGYMIKDDSYLGDVSPKEHKNTYADGRDLSVGDVVKVWANGFDRGLYFVRMGRRWASVEGYMENQFSNGVGNYNTNLYIELVKTANEVEVGESYGGLHVTEEGE